MNLNGYVVVRNVFSEEEIDDLHELISESSKIATFDLEKTTVGGGIAEKKLSKL
ncbi:hypothetical protein [Staphylococcus equorum]|uniref:Uncharacterized protein n=1 Tax=Staphylococcus equorum TaxID=246432 RepID=A0A9X4R390_9STAP|nr:hypothetical protein [Staphylococcus equorum]MDG0860759.1 hypothetical protein [Staphylococcus equorum]